MQKQKRVTLDLKGCKDFFDIHNRIKEAFDFPEWYGKNWDAFWDLLWSECDADEIVVTGEKSLGNEFKKDLLMLHEILDRFCNDCNLSAEKYDHCKPLVVRIVD